MRQGTGSSAKTNVFNELEALQMIPAVIRKLQTNKLSEHDQNLLHMTYGDLWQLIVKEAKRPAGEDVSPILKSLIEAREAHRSSVEMGNDVEKNSLQKVVRRSDQIPARLVTLRLSESIPPAQRLLKVAAILIRDAISKRKPSTAPAKAPRRKNHAHKKQLKSRGNRQTQRARHAVRSKRSLNRIESAVDEDMALSRKMREIIDPVAAAEDVDYEMYDEEQTDAGADGQAENQKNQAQQMKREQQAKQLSFIKGDDYKDYAFDTTDTDHFSEEEDLLSSFYGLKRRSAYDDYEYNSFSDLMHLAAKHAFRSQRENDYANDEEYAAELYDDYTT